MTQPLHPGIRPGAHPDADQISTFVEGAASVYQRRQILAHLADCIECRELVFLMQSPMGPEPVAARGLEERRPRRWFLPLGLAGAALAGGMTALVYFGVHRSGPEPPSQVATMKTAPASPVVGLPSPVALPPTDRRAAQEHKQPREEPQPQRGAEVLAQRDAVGAAAGMNALKQPAPPPMPAEPVVGSASAAPVAPPSAAPAPAARASASSTESDKALKKESVNEPAGTVTGRNFAALSMVRPAPALRIEHDRGPADGNSEISGRVTDESGAVIPSAEVALRDSKGTTRQTTTDAAGKFSLAMVAPEHYRLTVTARGFGRAQQQMDLQSRDVAQLDTVLRIGAASETVEVEAEQNSLQTQQAPMSDSARAIGGALPGGKPAASRVVSGDRMLSVDAAGTLFLSRNGGKSWKKVKAVWTGKVTQLALSDQAAATADELELKRKRSAKDTSLAFKITTDAGVVWISDDGARWRPR